MKFVLATAIVLFAGSGTAAVTAEPITICPKELPQKSVLVYQFQQQNGAQGPGRLIVCTKKMITTERLWRDMEEYVRVNVGPEIDGKKVPLRNAVLLNAIPLAE